MAGNRNRGPTIQVSCPPHPRPLGRTTLVDGRPTPFFLRTIRHNRKISSSHPIPMAQLYSDLDDEIGRFFSQVSATRAECDDLARTRLGGLVEPVPIQGATSYTVVVGLNREKIVRFRTMDAQLDMRTLGLARQVHGDVVPLGAVLGHIGDDAQRQLAIYEMDRLPGDNYAMVRTSLAKEPQSQLATIHSLARFAETPH